MKRLLAPLALTVLLGCATVSRQPSLKLYGGQTSLGKTKIERVETRDSYCSGTQVTISKGDTTLVLFNRGFETNDFDLCDQGDYAHVTVRKFFIPFSATFAHDYVQSPFGERLESRLIDSYSPAQRKKIIDSKQMLNNRFTKIYRTAMQEANSSCDLNSNSTLIDLNSR